MPPLQEKESPPIDEAACRDTLAADTKVSPLPSQVEAPITKNPQKLSYQERKQAALDNYLSLWLVLQKAKGRWEVREISPGSWTFVDGDTHLHTTKLKNSSPWDTSSEGCWYGTRKESLT
jgi:hypothetical protein